MKDLRRKCAALIICAALVILAVQPAAAAGQAQKPVEPGASPTLVQALSAAAADSAAPQAEKTGIVGIWKVIEISSPDGTTTKEDIEKYEATGSAMYLDIREDGTLTASGFGEDTDGTWDEKTVTMSGQPASYAVEGSRLTLTIDDSTMVLERTTIEAIYEILGYKEGILDETIQYSKEETLLLDKEEITVKIVGYKADMTGFTADMRCENKTENKLIVSTGTTVVNKYNIDTNWAVSLEAKETKDTKLTFRPADLEKCGISAVDELILSLKVIDQDEWKQLYDGKQTDVYPTGKKPQDIKTAERTPAENEKILVDNKDCLYALQGAGTDLLLGYSVNYYYENRTDKKLTFMWSKCSINGNEITAYSADEALPGTRGYSKAFIQASSLEKKGIEKVEEIKFTLTVYDQAEKVPKKILEEEFTYKP